MASGSIHVLARAFGANDIFSFRQCCFGTKNYRTASSGFKCK
jgi:hypothetical protein